MAAVAKNSKNIKMRILFFSQMEYPNCCHLPSQWAFGAKMTSDQR